MTKSHNSCKTCNIAKSCLYGHLHVMLVTVCGYEQNPSRGVGGVAHTRIWVVRTDRRTSGEVQILMPTHNFVGGIIMASYIVLWMKTLKLCAHKINDSTGLLLKL